MNSFFIQSLIKDKPESISIILDSVSQLDKTQYTKKDLVQFVSKFYDMFKLNGDILELRDEEERLERITKKIVSVFSTLNNELNLTDSYLIISGLLFLRWYEQSKELLQDKSILDLDFHNHYLQFNLFQKESEINWPLILLGPEHEAEFIQQILPILKEFLKPHEQIVRMIWAEMINLDFREWNLDRAKIGKLLNNLGLILNDFELEESINEFLAELMPLSGLNSAFIPFARTGCSAVSIENTIFNMEYDADYEKYSYNLYEKNPQLALIASINLFFNTAPRFTISTNNILEISDPLFYKADLIDTDFVWANPPWDIASRGNKEFNTLVEKSLNVLFKDLDIKRGLVVIPLNLLTTTREGSIMMELLKNNSIETIIKFPQNSLAGTVIQPCVLIIDKTRGKRNSEILFIDFSLQMKKFDKANFSQLAEKAYESWKDWEDVELLSKRVPYTFLKSNKFNLNPEFYVSNAADKLDSILDSSFKSIKDVITGKLVGKHRAKPERTAKAGRRRSFSNILITEEPYTYSVRISDISAQASNKYLDPSVIEIKEQFEKVDLLTQSAVLVNTVGNKLHAVIYRHKEGERIQLGNNTIALFPDTNKVTLEYLWSQLQSELTQLQLKAIVRGTAIPYVRGEDLLNIKIKVPSRKEQERSVLETEGGLKREEQFSEALTSKEITILSGLKHSLMQQVGAMNNDLWVVEQSLNAKETSESPFRWEDEIRSKKANENSAPTFTEIFQRLKGHLKYIKTTFSTIEQIILVESDLKVDQEVNLKEFIEETSSRFLKANFPHALLEVTGKNVTISIHKKAMEEAIRNLLTNAIRHGFTNKEKEYKIYFEIKSTSAQKEVQIIYKNNGNPFPPDFTFQDYISYGVRGGATRGTGLGGYLVNKVIELHNGNMNMCSPLTTDPFSVQFEINLPIN